MVKFERISRFLILFQKVGHFAEFRDKPFLYTCYGIEDGVEIVDAGFPGGRNFLREFFARFFRIFGVIKAGVESRAKLFYFSSFFVAAPIFII